MLQHTYIIFMFCSNMGFSVKNMIVNGKEYLPIIEGGKGIFVSTGKSAGHHAKAGAIGTFSGVNADSYDENGNTLEQTYKGKTRAERHEELINYGIVGGVAQAKIARDISGGNGRVHMNVLWEMGGAERILHGILEKTKGLVDGITCGAGMPYRLAEIAQKYNVNYFPIVSSMRAFRALWKRSYSKASDLLGGVVYEDPWRAGGHNGLSNSEDPLTPEDPYPRLVQLRKFMNEVGLTLVPIIMAGGVWHLSDWSKYIDNPEIGEISFQFGTRPILTQESEVPQGWKDKLLTLKEGDVYLNKFSPTGFYSSAVENNFLKDLIGRSNRQAPYSRSSEGEFTNEIKLGARGRSYFFRNTDHANVLSWIEAGHTEQMRTPEDTLVFVTPDKAQEILKGQADCMGCLSHCGFSNWKDHDDFTTGKKADPRSFCIQKTLQDIAHGSPVDENLMFAGTNAYKFGTDPFYANGNVPTVQELIDRIMTGA